MLYRLRKILIHPKLPGHHLIDQYPKLVAKPTQGDAPIPKPILLDAHTIIPPNINFPIVTQTPIIKLQIPMITIGQKDPIAFLPLKSIKVQNPFKIFPLNLTPTPPILKAYENLKIRSHRIIILFHLLNPPPFSLPTFLLL